MSTAVNCVSFKGPFVFTEINVIKVLFIKTYV